MKESKIWKGQITSKGKEIKEKDQGRNRRGNDSTTERRPKRKDDRMKVEDV
jgi:hypothetical protein